MNRDQVITRAIELLAIITAAFGGVLTGVAPPEETGIEMAVGIASFGSLFLILFASALTAWRHPSPGFWLLISSLAFVAFLIAGLGYAARQHKLTILLPPYETPQERVVIGTTMHSEMVEKFASYVGSVASFVDDAGGIYSRELIWTRDSIQKANEILVRWYVAFFLSTVFMIIGGAEAVLAARSSSNPAKDVGKLQTAAH